MLREAPNRAPQLLARTLPEATARPPPQNPAHSLWKLPSREAQDFFEPRVERAVEQALRFVRRRDAEPRIDSG
ncbi:MAG: hypothetical protein OEP95_15650, partial [Myxococcales bacterium]|nr:hypothetical protein [Myxococcales bacterium]